ncbi:helix-turn-helix domain-containing protein [Streptomyces sp. DT171]|uniref:helix-turn-helix domain-containing protein n=1 Tax=Streptomyces sp. DT171 TaxID=3416524 RepID=UPI003CF64E13
MPQTPHPGGNETRTSPPPQPLDHPPHPRHSPYQPLHGPSDAGPHTPSDIGFSGPSDIPSSGPPAGPAAPRTAFATAFREALRRRGLSLERVRDRLETQGIVISLATLSYWQRGRSQPEQARSLHAVDALETILDLPTGALRSLVGPRRPRGGALSGRHDLTASHRLYGRDSVVERALGESFAHFNEDTTSLLLHETVRVDENRCVREMNVRQVVRATRDGADRLTAVHCLDGPTVHPVDVSVRCGGLGEVRHLPELGSLVADILFGRELVKNETVLIDYTVSIGPSEVVSTHHERRTRVNLREYLLHVYFHPSAPPASCHRYFRENITAEKLRNHRIPLDASYTAHVLPAKCPPGIHGMSWEWPETPTATRPPV